MSERISDERLAYLVEAVEVGVRMDQAEIAAGDMWPDAPPVGEHRDILSALRELAELREQVRWRPMEEAPRGGIAIEGYWSCALDPGEPRIAIVKCRNDGEWVLADHAGSVLMLPDYWRPVFIGPLPGGDV